MTLSNQTIEILEDIERRLDPEAEDDYMKQWEDFLYDRFDGGVFTPRRKTASELNFKHPPPFKCFSTISFAFSGVILM